MFKQLRLDISNRSHLWIALFCILLVKIVIALRLPLTGDEAYYALWANHLAGGYYDHPPMVAWLIAPFLSIDQSILFFRLPAIFLPFVVGFFIFDIVKRVHSRETAVWTLLVFLLAPIHLLGVLTVTDTPFILFTTLSLWAYWRAVKEHRFTLYVLSGLALGGALLSKYFALFLAIGFFVDFLLFRRRDLKVLAGLGITAVSCLPALAFHLYWNSQNCWVNLGFNLASRHGTETYDIGKAIEFLAFQIVLASPFVLWASWRDRAHVFKERASRYFWTLYWVAFAIFFVTSIKYAQGLHWMLAFYVPFFIAVGLNFSGERLKWLVKITAVASAIIVAVALFFVENPDLVVSPKSKRFKAWNMFIRTNEIVEIIRERERRLGGDVVLAAPGYTVASLLSFHHGKKFAVFGKGSRFGRQDDFLTDFRELDRRDFIIFSRHRWPTPRMRTFFENWNQVEFKVGPHTYYLIEGLGFRYDDYRREVLERTLNQYYSFPDWIPKASACPVVDRYRN